jgi:prepilin-type processing-associated H-X9-DG protein
VRGTAYGWGLTSYLAVIGSQSPKNDGIINTAKNTQMTDITDGTSNTLMVGERPSSPNGFWGWWDLSVGDNALHASSSTAYYTSSTGVGVPHYQCSSRLPAYFQPGYFDNDCDTNHFWATHTNGGNWLFGDGSVRFLSYAAGPLTIPLASKDGGEVVDSSQY